MYARHVSIHNEHDFFLLFFYYEHIKLFLVNEYEYYSQSLADWLI